MEQQPPVRRQYRQSHTTRRDLEDDLQAGLHECRGQRTHRARLRDPSRLDRNAPTPVKRLHTPPSTPTTLWGTTPTSPAMTLAQARSSMQRQPLVPPVTIAGIHRSQIAEPAYLTGSNTNAHQIPGVRLIYGHVGIDRFGGATYNGPYISITEFPARNAAVLYQGLSYFPDANRAIIENTTATLKTHGLYII